MYEDKILIQNIHWKNKQYDYCVKRNIFKELIKELDYKHITAITGPRRVGKTVLMKQIITYLLNNNVPKENILYFSFDDIYEKEGLQNILNTWQNIINKDFSEDKFYVFFDEIQKVDNWSDQIKIFYDLYESNLKFFISGSVSLNIKKKGESLAGRIKEFFINPLDYEEYLLFSNKPKIYLYDYFLDYLHKQLPSLALNDEEPIDYIKSIVQKVIYEDSVKYYNIDEPSLLESIFKIILRKPGQIINYVDLANNLDCNRNTVSKYIDVLEKSYLIRKLYNFSNNNNRKIEIKAKKYYPFFSSLLNYILPEKPDFGYILETFVAEKINANYFHNVDGKEIDFILLQENKKIGIELKASNYVAWKDVKYLEQNKLHLDKKLLITLPTTKIGFKTENIFVINIMDFIKKGLKEI